MNAHVWSLKVMDLNPTTEQYEERYTMLCTSSNKARKKAVDYLNHIKNEDKILENKYSKTLFCLTGGSGSAHCIIDRQLVV